jgi:tRNA 5-methylaminomethyl-2-thiouridine biosynthesis bifunctional protein
VSSDCVIIGAGIAGACTAASLARRGWHVTVLDAAPSPAGGASGLPVGLYAPYKSADNNFTSQITAIGVSFTQQLAKNLLTEGVDWRPSGLMTRKYGEPEQWHPEAGWIKPAALVNACLAQTGVAWRGNCDVKRLVRDGDVWSVLDAENRTLAQAGSVVVATANQSADLLRTASTELHLNLQAIRGQVTFSGLQSIPSKLRSNFPVNGNGSYIETNDSWLVAATYDRVNMSLDANVSDQVENFERLESLAPAIAELLKPVFTRGEVGNWVGIRCASPDRLPIVGEVAAGLWVLTALASRGLTFAPLCAELLASQMNSEAVPLNPRLVKALDVQRYMKKKLV